MTKRELNCREYSQEHYQKLSFTDFVIQHQKNMPEARLFELSLPWLIATKNFMLEPADDLIVHCLFNEEQSLLIAWPLVHQQDNKRIKSLSSFYSAIAEPIYFSTQSTVIAEQNLRLLLSFIENKFPWQVMQLGSFDDNSVTAKVIVDYFPAHKVFSQTDNVYQQGLGNYEQYFQQRPSQLRNTIKRRSKKLGKLHQYEIKIISSLADFPVAFTAYKDIYQQSWKGEEYSFAFIEQVCLAGLQENKLRLGLLYIDDMPVAAQIWFVQDCLSIAGQDEKNASIFKLAYHPNYQQFSVGSILSMALSEYVISQDKVTSIEFGMGSEPYKKDWLADKRSRRSFQVFNHYNFYGKLAAARYVLLPKLLLKLKYRTAHFFKL